MMAEGGEDEQSPKKTTTYNRFEGMNSQKSRYGVPDNEMFWLENIMRVAPKKLHSVPGPTGNLATFPIIPLGCLDSTLRGQQLLTQKLAYDQINSWPGITNIRTSWGYIAANGEVWSLIGNGPCGGGNANYDNICCTIDHWASETSVSQVLIPDPNSTPGINMSPGVSDEQAYYTPHVPVFPPGTSDGFIIHYPLSATFVQCFRDSSLLGTFPSIWTKFGNRIYAVGDGSAPGAPIGVWDSTIDGVPLITFSPVANFEYMQLQATNSFLYALGQEPHTHFSLLKINRTTGALVARYDLGITFVGAPIPRVFFVINDSLVYILCTGDPASLYYFDGTKLVYVGVTLDSGGGNQAFTTFAGNFVGRFLNSAMYFGGQGAFGDFADIFKIVVACPGDDGPVLVNISTDTPVANPGDAVNVSWSNLLLAEASNLIFLNPAPTGNQLTAFKSPGLAQELTGGTSSGTIPFTIPIGTTAGSYVFQLARDNGTWIANSDPFTVT